MDKIKVEPFYTSEKSWAAILTPNGWVQREWNERKGEKPDFGIEQKGIITMERYPVVKK